MQQQPQAQALIAAREVDVIEHEQVLYGLVKRTHEDEIVSSAATVNVIPRQKCYRMMGSGEMELFQEELMRRPIVLLPSVRIGKGINVLDVTLSTREERWILMVNQVHPKIQSCISINFEMAKSKLSQGDPFELVLSFNSFLRKVYANRLSEAVKKKFTSLEFKHAEIIVSYPGAPLKDRPHRKPVVTFRFDFESLEPGDIYRRTLTDAQSESSQQIHHALDTDKLQSLLPGWNFDNIVQIISEAGSVHQMGAGVVKLETGPNGTTGIHINTGRARMPTNGSQYPHAMKCEECSVLFTHITKQYSCKDCGRIFCSSCTLLSGLPQHQCRKCNIILAGNFTKEQLKQWKVKDLKALLMKQNVNISKCREKDDLIELIFRYFGNSSNPYETGNAGTIHYQNLSGGGRRERTPNPPPDTQSPPDPVLPGAVPDPTPCNRGNTPSNPGNTTINPGNQQGNQTSPRQPQQPNTTTAGNQPGNTQPGNPNTAGNQTGDTQSNQPSNNLDAEENKEGQTLIDNPRIKLDDIQSEEEIDQLSIKCLKRVLLNNFVDYKGCCERWELQERLKRLWRDNEVNKKKAEEQRKISENPSSAPTAISSSEDDICKICMDAAIDCVLLECGHMVTCTKCGKQLSECPICRQYVVRAVHTFKV